MEAPAMTEAVVYADGAAPARQGWRALLWILPLTAAWALLTYWQPAIQTSGIPSTAVRISLYAMITLGLWLSLERTNLTPAQRRNTWLAVMIPFTLWLAVVWSAAINGAFRPGVSPLPLLPLGIFLPVIVGVPLLLRSRRIGEVLDAMPPAWLVGLQVYRVFGSIFLVYWARGFAPGIFALPAGTGDVITGLFALPVAISVALGSSGSRKAAIAWNIFGLFDFAVAVTLGLITSPGQLQLIVPSIPNAATGLYPVVLTPTFVVPTSILLHALSLRQLRRLAQRQQDPRPAMPLTAAARA
jgi:hypothetical protein